MNILKATKKSAGISGRSRDFGLSGGPGKGSRPRNLSEKFRENFREVDFGVIEPDGFIRRGARQIKRYG